MKCEICDSPFNDDRKPRHLICGHSFCQPCLEGCIKNDSISCPSCHAKMSHVEVNSLPLNYYNLSLITSQASARAARHDSMAKESSSASRQFVPASAQRVKKLSPHGGRCLEAKAAIAHYCATCQIWLCETCARIDHVSRACLVLSQKETLSEMKDLQRKKAKKACRDLQHSTEEVKMYGNQLKSLEAIMVTTLDCIRKEQKRLEMTVRKCYEFEDILKKIVEDETNPDLLAMQPVLQSQDNAMSEYEKWMMGVLPTLTGNKTFKLAKELLCAMVQLHLASASSEASSQVLVLQTVNSTPLCSRLKTDGARLYMHTLQQIDPTSGARGLPLKHVKSFMNAASALTFFELSWGDSRRGRIFIRLFGQSTRAQQFLLMCTGEMGPSFYRTRFHRVWWKNQAGEHVWAGDYDEGDGSGGVLPSEVTAIHQRQTLPADVTKLPITPGLVAGVYGKEYNSSIFRIYTKESRDAVEEAAFGRVEYGLQVLDAAVQHGKITDVIISDCGVIIEP